MPLSRDAHDRAVLEINARHHRHNPILERAADLIDAGDYAAFAQLPASVQSRAPIYADFRRYYRDAVAAGVVPDDRSGPSAP
ncbi:MAG: hypothetical protein M3R02_27645 [Chloroflexota bacterium]|nr:hypothetical protein [Chloroflexota bacterium]MDP9459462.1 hypothetical protein [Actinomycetota bacterium]